MSETAAAELARLRTEAAAAWGYLQERLSDAAAREAELHSRTGALVSAWDLDRCDDFMAALSDMRGGLAAGPDWPPRAPGPTDLLARLAALCACEVSVTINAHRCYYEAASDYLDRDGEPDFAAADREEMVRLDTVVEVQAYPDTPVGSYRAVHWDLRTALAAVVQAVESERKRKGA